MAATAIGAGWSMLCAIIGSLVLSKQKQYRDNPNSPTYDKVVDAALFGMSATGGGIMALIVCALLQWIGLRADIALLRTGKREESMTAEETSHSEDIQGNLGYCIMIAVVIIGGLGQAFGVIVLRTVLSGGYSLGPAVNTSAAGMMIIYASIAGIYVIVNLCGYFFDC
ncbi:hypothetical protein WOLCODRAFT_141190 [Wolfiporia cocos MD-104 SS10]|uniref:Uncharacterized protein n=1 Tax=Wolfiporia cocos (strain MD-104) TaxID=742152 RepID=A0A2H3JAN7_WOLCO|nr:hypothetical protein WOLCODRAFT_141190 [Wolfiporia cocos MD-104 SS10]